jgi:hypothetical protein
MKKGVIISGVTCYKDRYQALRVVHLACDEFERLFCSRFEISFRMISHVPTYWSKAIRALEGSD